MLRTKDVELFKEEKKKTAEDGEKQQKETMPWFHNVQMFKEEKKRKRKKMQDTEKMQDT